MKQSDAQFSTGLIGLDGVLNGLMPGDNVVWQVDSVEDYAPFVDACWRDALRRGQKVVYFRFAQHGPLMGDVSGVEIHHLLPEAGFEQFIGEIHRVIEDVGGNGYYLFDCLSHLVVDWNSDRMLGNFFMLTCPRLYYIGAIAYFSLLRDKHSFHATGPISDTTQVLIEVYRCDDKIYVHPVKVQRRNSPTMYMLHAWEGDDFVPVTQSVTTADILSPYPWNRLDIANYQLGFWSSTFIKAEEVQASIERG